MRNVRPGVKSLGGYLGNVWMKFFGCDFLRGMFGELSGVVSGSPCRITRIPVQDYKSLRPAVMI